MTEDKAMKLGVRVGAPVARVWQALTDAQELEIWLAEHAEVDLPRAYTFWGRYTPEGDARRQRLVHVDEHAIQFVWTLEGVDTTVNLSVESDATDSSVVTVSQTGFDFQLALAETSNLGVIYTFWALSLGNLVDYLEGRGVAHRCDFTTTDLRAEVLINAPRERVYQALVDSEQASVWFGFPIGIEPWVGGRFAMGGLEAHDAARIVALEPGRKMSVDWSPGGETWDMGVATWELEDSQGKTRLTFVQSGFNTPRTPYAAWLGTVAGMLSLRRFVEDPNWRSIYVEASGVA